MKALYLIPVLPTGMVTLDGGQIIHMLPGWHTYTPVDGNTYPCHTYTVKHCAGSCQLHQHSNLCVLNSVCVHVCVRTCVHSHNSRIIWKCISNWIGDMGELVWVPTPQLKWSGGHFWSSGHHRVVYLNHRRCILCKNAQNVRTSKISEWFCSPSFALKWAKKVSNHTGRQNPWLFSPGTFNLKQGIINVIILHYNVFFGIDPSLRLSQEESL